MILQGLNSSVLRRTSRAKVLVTITWKHDQKEFFSDRHDRTIEVQSLVPKGIIERELFTFYSSS